MIGYTFLLIGSSMHLQYMGVILVAFGNGPAITLVSYKSSVEGDKRRFYQMSDRIFPKGVAWLSNNQRGHTRRGVALSASNTVSQVRQYYRGQNAYIAHIKPSISEGTCTT